MFSLIKFKFNRLTSGAGSPTGGRHCSCVVEPASTIVFIGSLSNLLRKSTIQDQVFQ